MRGHVHADGGLRADELTSLVGEVAVRLGERW